MRGKIKSLFQLSQFQKVGSYNAFAMGIKMITGLVISKFTALILGPSGLALLENLRNLLNTSLQLSSFGLDKGIVSTISSFNNNKKDIQSLVVVLWWLGVFSCLIFGSSIWFFATQLSAYVFGSVAYQFTFKALALCLPFHILNIFFTAILKGKEKHHKLIHIQIAGHILNLILFISLIYWKNLEGAFLALVLLPGIVFFITAWFSREELNLLCYWSLSKNAKKFLFDLLQYSLMAVFASTLFAFVYIEIRNHIIENLGEDEAGWWSGVNRISNYYILFFIGLINLILLPKLAKSETNFDFKLVITDFYKQIIPWLIGTLLIVFLFKKYVVWITLSTDFLPATNLFLGQVIGDFFRIMALVLAYQFHAKKMTIQFILTDLFLGLCIFLTSIYFIDRHGLQGVVWAHSLSYFAYFILVLFYFRKVFLFPLFRKTAQ